jgi:hypothetical protein
MSFSDFQGTNLAVFEAGKLISRGVMVCKNGFKFSRIAECSCEVSADGKKSLHCRW